MNIRILILFFIVFLGIYACGSKKKKLQEKYGDEEKTESKHTPTLAEIFSETITVDDLDFHVYNLSDDRMTGRETGKPGGAKAAKYIGDFFLDQDLLLPKEHENYFQKYTAVQNDKPSVVLETDSKAYQYGEDFISFFPLDSIEINVNKIIYAGYGIEDPKHNDYVYKDVKDKVVLVVGGEPHDKYGNYIISNEVEPYSGRSLPSVWSRDPIKAYILKRNTALKYGAKVMLYYDPQNINYFWSNFKKHFEKKQLKVSDKIKKDTVYNFFINKDIFTDITGYDRPEDIEYNKKTREYSVPIKMSYKIKSEIIEAKNVIGILEGDKKNDEYIVILSHYDGQGKHNGQIYNSANDNATGVAASFEIIEAFNAAKDSGFAPRRHIVFINFSGKEQDMIGSKYYMKHPIIPLEKTIAVIELHKLGRIKDLKDEDTLPDIYPINIAFKGFEKGNFRKNIEKIQSYNNSLSLKFKPLVESSDYTHFMKKNIPVIYFYGSNDYSDYHNPTDTADKINYDILEKRTRFIFQIIWQLAYQEKL